MEHLPALAIVMPLVAATAIMAVAPLTTWRLRDAAGIAAAAAAVVLTVWLTTSGGLVVSWMGGWQPVRGLAIGIGLAVDPLGAGIAALAAVLTTAALVYSWRYFEAIGALYHTLMLLFLGGMIGFSLTGDLFNLFVFFELLTTAAYALTAYRIEREAPLQGSLNFAVTNTIGAFLLLHGIALLYGHTGALNLAEIGRELAGNGPDLVLIASFVLVSAGLLTKAAIVPFHFWLADAHSVAPSPVSVLLSGVMIELGLYGWVRIYWTVFAVPFADHVATLRPILVALGVATAVLAGGFALLQHNVKRLLAYSSISHSGLILTGIGLLDAEGLAGAGLYTLAHGAIKGALFLLVGILLHRHGTVDEVELYGRGRRQPLTGVLVVLAALGLAGLPPFGTTLGKQLVEEAAAGHGLGVPVTVAFVAASALTAGAVLRVAGRVFLGIGPTRAAAEDMTEDEEEPETSPEGGRRRTPVVMVAPVVALLALAVVVGTVPDIGRTAEAGARLATDTAVYAAAVLDGATGDLPEVASAPVLSVSSVALGGLAALLAVAVALLGLGGERLPTAVRRLGAFAIRAVGPARQLQSGQVGDYVAWMTFGVAVLGVSFLVALS